MVDGTALSQSLEPNYQKSCGTEVTAVTSAGRRRDMPRNLAQGGMAARQVPSYKSPASGAVP